MPRIRCVAAREFQATPRETTMAQQSDKSPLPPLTPITGLTVEEPLKLLAPEEREGLKRNLDEMARSRREAEAKSHTLRLS